MSGLALAVGTGLVIGILGASNGLSRAQREVLSPLSNVGADLAVGTPAAAQELSAPTSGATLPGSIVLAKDLLAVLMRSAAPGKSTSYTLWSDSGLQLVPGAAAAKIARIGGVQASEPALVVQLVTVTGTVSDSPAGTGTRSSGPVSRIAPLTAAEQRQARQCLIAAGALPGPSTTAVPGTGEVHAGLVARFATAYPQCFPARFGQSAIAAVPPAGTGGHRVGFTTGRLGLAGIDPRSRQTGLVTTAQLVAGSWFGPRPAHQALVNVAYADQNHISPGQTISVDHAPVTVVGLVNPADTTAVSDVYLTLSTLQSLTGAQGRVNEVLVKVVSSGAGTKVDRAIARALPGAQVVSGAQSQVQLTGVLATASKVASNLGHIVGIIVAAAALLIAGLTTLASITRRTREIGILRAIGWSKTRVARQLLGETLWIGTLGAVTGVLLGIGICVAVNASAPSLSYSIAPLAGLPGSSLIHNVAPRTPLDTVVQLRSVISVPLLLVAALLCIAGGLLAGIAGTWRAARVVPATALRNVE